MGGRWLGDMSRNTPGGFRRRPRVADAMTPELYACVDRALAAERAGDITAALEWHQSVPMFLRGRHRMLMTNLHDLGEDLPEWVWARWIAYQTTRCEDGSLGPLSRQRLRDLAEGFHLDRLEDCYRHRGDPIQVVAQLTGESWAYHQLVVHEDGGLARFVAEFARDRLAEHAALALRWAGTRMCGYELGESLSGARLLVRQADGEEWSEVLDLGARSCAPGGHVIGRLVPSGEGDRLMFDMPPLGVPAPVARAVAARADGDWWRVVSTAARCGRLAPATFLREDYELTTDVQELDLVRFGTPPGELARVMGQLREGRDEVSRAAYRVLDRARRGAVDPADQAYVGAAALNVRAFADLRRETVRNGRAGCWAEWAERVVEPARSRLLTLARLGRSAA